MKKLSIAAILLALMACNTPTTPISKEKNTPKEEVAKLLYTHFNNHDWQKMAALYADTAEFKDPSLGKGIVKQTHEQIAKKYAELNQMFPDIHDEIKNIYVSGDKNVIVEFVSTGTAPDKTKMELPICTIFTIENGLITKDFTYYDNE